MADKARASATCAGSSARCSSSRRRSTTSTGKVLGILKPELQKEIGWNEIEYGNIVVAFHLAYAIGLLIVGWIIDRIGTRHGFAASVVWWSLAARRLRSRELRSGSASPVSLLGLGEGGNFPASIKTVAEWFPKKERAFATGVFNAGTNVGAIVTPLVVPWISLHWGWQWAVRRHRRDRLPLAVRLVTGFYRTPEEHPRLSSRGARATSAATRPMPPAPRSPG